MIQLFKFTIGLKLKTGLCSFGNSLTVGIKKPSLKLILNTGNTRVNSGIVLVFEIFVNVSKIILRSLLNLFANFSWKYSTSY